MVGRALTSLADAAAATTAAAATAAPAAAADLQVSNGFLHTRVVQQRATSHATHYLNWKSNAITLKQT